MTMSEEFNITYSIFTDHCIEYANEFTEIKFNFIVHDIIPSYDRLTQLRILRMKIDEDIVILCAAFKYSRKDLMDSFDTIIKIASDRLCL